ncbi:MAG: class I SAM-dependent methyltransferase [Flavobacterium sp.]
MDYIGNELELFKHAHNWKNYYSKHFKKLLTQKVLEVGAGIGETTKFLCDGTQKKWLCVEPDEKLTQIIKSKKDSGYLPQNIQIFTGTLDSLTTDEKFDAILYIDVIEHIENDSEELKKANERLAANGNLIVLVPAHNFLFSPFDKAIGHYRRYNKKMLQLAVPKGLTQKKLIYLDSVGLLASLVNKFFLKQSYPTVKQVLFWDKFIIPVSRVTDKVFFNSIGKTTVGIWQKKTE